MEEQSRHKSSAQQDKEAEKPNQTGLIGGLTLAALPMMFFAGIMGILKALEFVDLTPDEDEPEQDEVENI